jgi:hypothetical protein
MTNVDAGGPVTEQAEPERKKIANRLWIDDSGAEVPEEQATGIAYEFLGRTKDGVTIPADGKRFVRYFRDMSEVEIKMLAGFGAITLMGNVTNTWMGDKSDEKHASAHDAIADRFVRLNAGEWIDRSAVGVGARVDKDVLAEAICQVAEAAGQPKDKPAVRAKLEDSAEFTKSIRAVPAIAAKYSELMGRKSPSLDTLLAAI